MKHMIGRRRCGKTAAMRQELARMMGEMKPGERLHVVTLNDHVTITRNADQIEAAPAALEDRRDD